MKIDLGSFEELATEFSGIVMVSPPLEVARLLPRPLEREDTGSLREEEKDGVRRAAGLIPRRGGAHDKEGGSTPDDSPGASSRREGTLNNSKQSDTYMGGRKMQ